MGLNAENHYLQNRRSFLSGLRVAVLRPALQHSTQHARRVQEIKEQEASHERRWDELVDTARAARAASERATQAQQAQRAALTAALDADIRRLHGAAADLRLCSSKLESSRHLGGGSLPRPVDAARPVITTPARPNITTPAGPAVCGPVVNAAAAAEVGGGDVGGRAVWRWGEPNAPAVVDVGADTDGQSAVQAHGGLQESRCGRWVDAPVEDLIDEARTLCTQVDSVVDSAQAARRRADADRHRHEAALERWRDRDALAREAAADLQERTTEVRARRT